MKNWQETKQVFDELTSLGRAGQRAALAVVYRIEGSAYRRAGAKLLVHEDGRLTGNVSGGCLESDLRERGLEVIASGRPQRVHYSTGDEEDLVWGLGLGCNGKMDLVVLPFPQGLTEGICTSAADLLDAGGTFALSVVVHEDETMGQCLLLDATGLRASTLSHCDLKDVVAEIASTRLAAGHGGTEQMQGMEIFTEVLNPPPDLVVCGAGDDAIPLVDGAARAGFRVTVVDHRRTLLTDDRYPEAAKLVHARSDDADVTLPSGGNVYAVIMTHILQQDQGWAGRFFDGEARYIGLLGSKARRERILQALGAASDPRVFGPIGLDVGAEGPEQIAVSIVAEMLAVAAGRTPGHLRDREAPIHT